MVLLALGCDESPLDSSGDGNGATVFSGPIQRWMSWSPSGTEIVFEQNGLLIVGRGADLKDAQAITGRGTYQHPAWSPDGRYIAYDYAPDRYRRADLWARPADASEIPRRLTDTVALDFMPKWSADGRWIAFHSRRSPGNHVWVVPAEGGEPEALGQAFANEWSLAWSPEGATLAYEGYEGTEVDIWAADAATRSVWRLAGTIVSDWHPIWRPDGNAVSFLSRRDGSSNVWVQDLTEDAEPTQLTTIGDVARFDWLPGGRALMFMTTDLELYAQASEPGATPTHLREAADFAVPRQGTRYAYVQPVETYFRYYAAEIPPEFR